MNAKRRVVVTGMGVLSPVGSNLNKSWKTIISGKTGICKLEGPHFESLPCKIAGLVTESGQRINLGDHFSKVELKQLGPATSYALIAAKEALEDARLINIDDEVKQRIGVAVGMGMVDLESIYNTYESLKKGYNQVSPFFVPRILPNMAAGQISIKFGLRGPNHAVSTACATGAHAIGDSFNFIQIGAADAMVCGGAEACISPLAITGFCRLRALSTNFNDTPEKASRPFDKRRDGFVMGEGSAILVLEELEHARNRKVQIYGEILGYGLSGDAAHLTAPRADGMGAVLAMKRALDRAGAKIEDVGYVNAHATSTPVGDGIEVKAIENLFGEKGEGLAVSSTKGAHGHLLGAAGSLESVFTLKAVQEGLLPPTANLEDCEDSNLNFVPNNSQKWGGDRRIALKNAFGFGGTNASLCISNFCD